METIPVLAFTCPSERKKGLKEATCHGLMACQLLDSEKGRFLVYCAKCSHFFLAVPNADGMYELTEVDKNDIKFISMPFVLKDKK